MEENEGQLRINLVWEQTRGIPTPVNQVGLSQGVGLGGGPVSTYEMHFGFAAAPMGMDITVPSSTELNLPINGVGHYQVSVEFLEQMHSMIGELLVNHQQQIEDFRGAGE